MKKISLLFACVILVQVSCLAQAILKVEPTHWWVGMKNPKVQVLVYGNNIASYAAQVNYNGVTLEGLTKTDNPNYLFLNLLIAPDAKPGVVNFEFSKTVKVAKGKKKVNEQIIKLTQPYELKVREAKPSEISSKDLIYLVLPDRFSNGDSSNDKFADMADKEADRTNPFLRHGGDLKGIENHLDYFTELGITTLWLNPVNENNQPQTNEGGAMRSAYHGYGFTDHYNIDKRLGGNKAYKELITAAHAKGIKIIQDVVYNHIGINHWMMKDLPMKDWLNNWDTYTNTSYRDEPVIDLEHHSKFDFKVQQNGWSVPFLPDLNNKNELVATYLIQNALWMVENFGIDGWRIDTYQYNDLYFMNRCNTALLTEYPNMFITGENSVQSVYSQAFFVENNINIPFKSTLPSANDFVLGNNITEALNQNFDWGKGLNKIYTVLASDALYKDANKNMIFLDNHDTDRFYSTINEDYEKYKMGLGVLLTTRGVPQIYYGTENLTKNKKDPSDAEVRKDFVGGWPDDKVSKFTEQGRTPHENEAFAFVKKLAHFRKNSSAIGTGKLTQFLPFNGFYVYFRHNHEQTVMVVVNQNKESKDLPTQRFNELLNGFTTAKNIITDEVVPDMTTLKIAPMSITILELQK